MFRLLVLPLLAALSYVPTPSDNPTPQPPPLTQEEAKAAIHSLTRIGGCSQPDPEVFTSVLTAPAIRWKPLFGSHETDWLLPVKADYTVHCTKGNHNMHYGEVEDLHIEVHANFRFYKDPFGTLQIANNFDDPYFSDADQHWNDAQQDVHCREQRLAWLTYDPAGNITKRRTDGNNAYGFCLVRMNIQK